MKKVLKSRGVDSDDAASFIPLSIPAFGHLMIEVNVVSQHNGIKCSSGTISLNASMRGTVPTLSMFTGLSFQSVISSSVVWRG
jgi:hypothetical protein